LDKEKKDRIELLYRNLEYNSGAYIAAETAFPFWESAYALIIGQLFIAYFQSQSHKFIGPHMFIALFGLILSFFWFVLVSLNLQNANHIDSMLQESHRLLKEELNCTPANVHFIKIYPSPYEKARWSIWDIFWGNRPGNKPDFKKMLKSTWFYRRALPFVLFIIWSILLEMLVATIFIGHENQFL
jgi:hypothetical protein